MKAKQVFWTGFVMVVLGTFGHVPWHNLFGEGGHSPFPLPHVLLIAGAVAAAYGGSLGWRDGEGIASYAMGLGGLAGAVMTAGWVWDEALHTQGIEGGQMSPPHLTIAVGLYLLLLVGVALAGLALLSRVRSGTGRASAE